MSTAFFTAMATDGVAARSALTESELRICARLSSPRGRRDFRAGRLAAKRAASALIGSRSARRIEILAVEDGSPRLGLVDGRGRRRTTDAEISISHRNGKAVAVAAPTGVRVGVDLEVSGAISRRMAGYYLTPAETAMAPGCDPTLLWSLKEAAWKALRLGPSLPFKALELCCDEPGASQGVRVGGAFLAVEMQVAVPWPGYHMAVVWTRGGVA